MPPSKEKFRMALESLLAAYDNTLERLNHELECQVWGSEIPHDAREHAAELLALSPDPEDVYAVAWEIDIDARTPEEAASQALEIQRDPESIATVFNVTNRATGDTFTVDLSAEPKVPSAECHRNALLRIKELGESMARQPVPSYPGDEALREEGRRQVWVVVSTFAARALEEGPADDKLPTPQPAQRGSLRAAGLEPRAERLANKYGIWGDHPEFPVDDWRYEVANDDTRLGYWDWVATALDDGKEL